MQAWVVRPISQQGSGCPITRSSTFPYRTSRRLRLGRALGPDAIRLFGEDGSGVRILPPPVFLEGDDTYDLVVNVDSLTELAPDVARSYAEAIRARAALFLSSIERIAIHGAESCLTKSD